MENGNTCPQCGREIPPDTRGGECPNCLALKDNAQPKNVGPEQQLVARDQNLLFGILAIQLRLITNDQFVKAAASWSTEPTTSLGQRLAEAGILTPEDRKLVEDLVRRAIEDHGGDLSAAIQNVDDAELTKRLTIPHSSIDLANSPLTARVPTVDEIPGRYTRSSEYRRGGMGRILLVHDQYLARDIAMKELLPPSESGSFSIDGLSPVRATSGIAVRFLREARLTGQLEHPSIVPVYEMGRRPNGTLYYTMKLVRGRTLGKALQETKSMAERLSYLSNFLDLCNALAYAHDRNVIHRDIKPSNIMVGDFGETVVIDWGLAKVVGHADEDEEEVAKTWTELYQHVRFDSIDTVEGAQVGTPQYMAPEQVKGRIAEIDHRTDVFALGIVLYQILTGDRPFKGKSSRELFDNIINLRFTSVHEIAPDVPPELVSICGRAMQKRREDRYQSAKELADEIQRFLTGAVVQAYNYSPLELARKVYSRHRALANTAALAAGLLLALGIVSYVNIYRSRNLAVAAKQRETIARQAETEARQRAEAINYVNQIRLSQSLIQENNYPRAREVLWSTDSALRRWEWGMLIAKAHPELYSLEGYQGYALSSDGQRLARADRTKPIQIHDAQNGALRQELVLTEESPIMHHQFSPDNAVFCALSALGTLKLWDTNSWNEIPSPALHDGKADQAIFLPNNLLLTCAQPSSVKLWNVRTGAEVQSFTTNDQDVDFIQASADSTRIMTGANDGDLQIWDVASGEQVGIVKDWAIQDDLIRRSPKFSPSGRQIAMIVDDEIQLLNLAGAPASRKLKGDHGRVVSLEYDSVGKRIMVAGNEGTVIVWDTASGERLNRFSANYSLIKSIWSPDDSLICTLPYMGVPQVWSLEASTGKLVNRLGHNRQITPWIEFFPDSRQLLTASGNGSIKVWNALVSSHQSIVGSTDRSISSVSANRDASRVAIVIGNDSFMILDRQQNLPLLEYKQPSAPTAKSARAVISPNGEFVVSNIDSFMPTVFDIASARILSEYSGHTCSTNAVAISPDNANVLTAGWDGLLHIWDPESGTRIQTFQHAAEITELAATNESQVAVGDDLGNVVIYDYRSGRTNNRLGGLDAPITALAWSPDNSMLAIGCDDGRVALWKEPHDQSDTELKIVAKHIAPVRTICFPDQDRILTFSALDSRVCDVESATEIFSTDQGAEVAIRLADTGDLLSCQGGLLYQWDSVSEIMKKNDQSRSLEEQKQAFEILRGQRLTNPRPRYSIDSSERQIVSTTTEIVNLVLNKLDAEINRAADRNREFASAGGLGLGEAAVSELVVGLGLDVNDRITRIAGKPVTKVATAIEAIEAAKELLIGNPNQITIDTVRRDSVKQLILQLRPLREETIAMTLPRAAGIDILKRINDGYRQLQVGEEAQRQPVVITVIRTSKDRERMTQAKLSRYDRIVGFNGNKIDNYGQLLPAIEDYLPEIMAGDASTFSFDIRRGNSRIYHFVYDIE